MTRSTAEPEDFSSDDTERPRRPRRLRSTVEVPSVERLLQQIIELNGAVAIGALSAKEASLIGKNLKTVLDVQLKRANRDTTSPTQEALADLCRKDPKTLNAIQSFLTDEQLESLMDEISSDRDE